MTTRARWRCRVGTSKPREARPTSALRSPIPIPHHSYEKSMFALAGEHDEREKVCEEGPAFHLVWCRCWYCNAVRYALALPRALCLASRVCSRTNRRSGKNRTPGNVPERKEQNTRLQLTVLSPPPFSFLEGLWYSTCRGRRGEASKARNAKALRFCSSSPAIALRSC